MNIFWLDENLQTNAQYYCDKHVVKMPLEFAQMLSSAMHHCKLDAPYRLTHANHPCSKWVRKSLSNYQLLYDLALAVGDEYTHRYGKIHKSTALLLDNVIPRDIDLFDYGVTPKPNCTKMRFDTDIITTYRNYYNQDKAYMCTYKNRNWPEWLRKTQ